MSPHWSFEASRGARWIVVLVGVVWLSLGAGDWFMRMHWFRWHQRFVVRPQSPFGAPARPLQSVEKASSRGGDLSRLVGIPAIARRYEEEREACTVTTDARGFFNVPPAAWEHADIVVVGDSYMVTGGGTSDTFPAKLAEHSGLRVYNYAYAGRGPMWSLLRYLLSEGVREHSPRVVLWGLIEREMGGEPFGGIRAQLEYLQRTQRDGLGRARINWRELSARALGASLPNSSLAAQFSARAWTWARFYLLGRLHESIAAVHDARTGESMLLYVPSIEAFKWDARTRNLREVVHGMRLLRDLCQSRGTELVLLLIPDKERIYEDLIPASLRNQGDPILPSVIPELHVRLKDEGVLSISLLPDFQQARREGRRLYWQDDTHWNPNGIDLAVEVTWRELEPWWREKSGEPRAKAGGQ